jgi:uncharacterized membrane protein
MLAWNPLVVADDVGAVKVFNWLLYAYGVPAALAAGMGMWLYRAAAGGGQMPERVLGRALGVASIVFVWALVSLEVRQGFVGPVLNAGGKPSSAEMYAYSAAWGTLGTALLLGGIATRGVMLRWASLAMMLLTVLKVFLVDTANLSDVFRVLSFAGLGAALILLGLLYHYFVFRRAPARVTVA